MRIHDLTADRVRYGYRRITVLLKREGWPVGKKRIYRIYKAEGLEVRTKKRKKRAAQRRVSLPAATAAQERWLMDFMSDRLANGRSSVFSPWSISITNYERDLVTPHKLFNNNEINLNSDSKITYVFL